ncbi:RDD family protein [Streptomyces sp. 21So2-11]|uniref:RDD family protein n=1 Tax=Streptomyces sp. 21So2-11 TaxID=3144408 RepID=UPI0032192FB7
MTNTSSPEELIRPGTGRRIIASATDAALALFAGVAVGLASGSEVRDGLLILHPTSPRFWGVALAMAIAFSFVNHVLLTFSARVSIGKFLTGLRVVRALDAGRPRFWPLTGRWLFGIYWMVVFVPIHVAANSDVEQQDALGVRVVRHKRRTA